MIDATWYALAIPAAGVMVIGALAGLMGTFAFLQKQTMLGDAIAHAALPGIVGIFMLTHSSNIGILIFGGLLSGLCAVLLITLIMKYTFIGADAALGIILSVFFGVGLVLFTAVQKLPFSSQSVLNKFLFGSAATLVYTDLQLLCVLACMVCIGMMLLWRSCVITIFDPVYARTIGISVTSIKLFLYLMLVIVIVTGLYAVGVVLMSSLLVAPAVTARALTGSVHSMALCAALCGAGAGIIGMTCSALVPHMPTGPAIVVLATLGAILVLCWRTRKGNTV
jgi:manganese/zinc/iron transport system permease protein